MPVGPFTEPFVVNASGGALWIAPLADRTAVITRELPGFRGDLEWVHLQEGHHGVPFWPGGGSGVTVGPGIALGQADASLVDLYQPLESPN